MSGTVNVHSEYAQEIARMARNKENKVFLNSSVYHALIILKELIRNAESSVMILCGSMCDPIIYQDEEYLSVVEGFLNKMKDVACVEEPVLRVLFDSYNPVFEQSRIAQILKKPEYSGLVEIRKLKSAYKHIYLDSKPVHLAVADNTAYRIETDLVNRMAWGNFNDVEKARRYAFGLLTYFNNHKYTESVA
ncbi:hypothetical protein IR083_10200 [Dysgonomonas sp. GY75]|uniref:hypothetical protein n=1 Tax=Dysgonomonas sp. GY75 TaxID=2780419 RepID=UPI001883F0DE|nr:hypothetical protein [Dysgonomonas sp. GY75]MBF0649192.1 hypothetical protein [Dysgonomonas sp. GY75]